MDEQMNRIKMDIEYEEITLSIYRLGRIVVAKLLPDELSWYPEFDYTDEQEFALLCRLADLQSSIKTKDKYQEI